MEHFHRVAGLLRQGVRTTSRLRDWQGGDCRAAGVHHPGVFKVRLSSEENSIDSYSPLPALRSGAVSRPQRRSQHLAPRSRTLGHGVERYLRAKRSPPLARGGNRPGRGNAWGERHRCRGGATGHGKCARGTKNENPRPTARCRECPSGRGVCQSRLASRLRLEGKELRQFAPGAPAPLPPKQPRRDPGNDHSALVCCEPFAPPAPARGQNWLAWAGSTWDRRC